MPSPIGLPFSSFFFSWEETESVCLFLLENVIGGACFSQNTSWI